MFLAVINIVKLGKYLNSVHNKGKCQEARGSTGRAFRQPGNQATGYPGISTFRTRPWLCFSAWS